MYHRARFIGKIVDEMARYLHNHEDGSDILRAHYPKLPVPGERTMTESQKHLYLIFAFNEMSWYEIWHGYDLPEAGHIQQSHQVRRRRFRTALDANCLGPMTNGRLPNPTFDSFIEICKLHRSSASAE